MSDTAITTAPNGDSKIFGVSTRGWLAILLVATVCGNHLTVTLAVAIDAIKTGDFSKVGTFATIGEPLYSLAIGAMGFYFGSQRKQ